MTILITGATGTIGSEVLAQLAGEAVELRALTRSPGRVALPRNATAVAGDLGNLDSLRAALVGVSTLFLLAPAVPDELNQTMLAVDAAREAKVKGLVYLSVHRGEAFTDVPHFASKAVVERMIADAGPAATVLRPAYFMQNDLRQKDALLGGGFYAMPIGQRGVSMVDTRDIGRAAARELLRREQAEMPLPATAYALVGPEALGGNDLAALWSEVLQQPVRHGGDDLVALEQRLKSFGPAWLARDLTLMMRRYQQDGAVATPEELAQTVEVLGRAPRAYRAFAEEAAAAWRAR